MSAKTEIPGVNNAVEKLQELEDRMKNDDFGFRDNDVDNIDKVVDALYELESQRRKIHEELEKETIQSSVLRHQLKVLPGQIRDEVMEAVMSARLSNANVLLELQEKLKTMNNNIAALDKQARDFELENAKLQPERELLKQQHEEIISQLNQRMAEKACLQIALNETRDKVRQANQDIVDLEDGILQLKEDLIQERTEARQEKKRLKKAVTDTTQKTREQKDQNVTKKKELDVAQEKLMDSEGKLDSVRKSIRRYETSRAKLEGEERALAAQLSKQLKMNDQMRIRGTEILNSRIKEERDFKKDQQELLDTIKQFESDIVSEGLRSKDLQKKKVELQNDLKEKEEIMEEDAEKVKELDENLQAAKEALNTKAEEVGAMQTENIEMTEQIEELAESHKAVLAQLNKQIEEYRELLAKERKERLEVQSQKDEVTKNLDDLKTENHFFMTEMTNVVQDGKKKHQDLSNEGMQLQKSLKVYEEEITTLEQTLRKAQKEYQSMFHDYQKRTDMMEGKFTDLKEIVDHKEQELEELQFQYEQACAAIGEAPILSASSSLAKSVDLGIVVDQLDTVMSFTGEELRELRAQLRKHIDFRRAISEVSLTEDQKEEVLTLESDLEQKKKLEEERTPVFRELEDYFNQRSEEYDKMKKDIVAMKNKKQSLEEAIKRKTKDKENLKLPQEHMRCDLKLKRQQLVEQMQQQGKSTNEMEEQILTAGCKLRVVVEENFKFEEKCHKLEEDLDELRKQMEENDLIRRRLELELTKQKGELVKKWETDNMMQDFFASRDEATAEAFGRLLSRTEKRENKIDMITERLKEELQFLAGFLDNISTRRPTESKNEEGEGEEDVEGSLSPDKAVAAVAEANQKKGAKAGSTATTANQTGSSPSPRNAVKGAKSGHCSRQGTAQSRQSQTSSVPTPRSVLKSPLSGRRSTAKTAAFSSTS